MRTTYPIVLALTTALAVTLPGAALADPVVQDTPSLWTTVLTGPAYPDDDGGRAVAIDPGTGQVLVGGYSEQPHTGRAEPDSDYLNLRLQGATGAIQGTTLLSSPGLGAPKGADAVVDLVYDAQRRHTVVTGTSQGPSGDTDTATVASDAAGRVLWTRRYDSGGPATRSDFPADLALDPATGNVFVLVTGAGDATTSDARLVVYSPSGKLLGTRAFGVVGASDTAVAVAVRPDGTAVATAAVSGGEVVTTVAVRPDGTLLWSASYDGATRAGDLVVDARTGSVYVSVSVARPTLGTEARVVSYTPDGAFRWISEPDEDGIIVPSFPGELVVTGRGEVVLASSYQDFDDGYVVAYKFSPTGQLLASELTFVIAGIGNPVLDLQLDPDTGHLYALVNVAEDFLDETVRLLVYDDGLRLRKTINYATKAAVDRPGALAIDSARNRVVITGVSGTFTYNVFAVAYATVG